MFRSATIFFLLSIPCVFATQAFAELSTVSVQGSAELMVPADRVNFQVGVVTEADDPQQAVARNSALVDKVLRALQVSGLAENEISTGHFMVDPRWSQRPHPVPDGWKSEIIGYRVTSQLKISTLKIEKVGNFISAAVKAGSNEVNGLQFDLANPHRYRQEAIRMATQRANEDARVLAVAAGLSLGRTVSLNLDSAGSAPIRAMVQSRFVAEQSPVPPITPGDVTVRANVTAVYELIDDRK